MDTQSIVVVAIVVNLFVAIAVVAVPRLRGRRPRASQTATSSSDRARHADSAGASQPRPASAAGDAGAAWFGGRTGDPATAVTPSVAATDPATDPATGLDLAPSWARWLDEEEARIRRFHRPATIVLVELAGLDRLAERLGDEAAHRLLPPIAKTMRRHARATDHLARLGRTRFGVILTETDEIRAINYVERIRSACDVWLEAGAVMLQLSVGWAEIGPERPAEEAILEAERRLFEERHRARSTLARQRDDRTAEMAAFRPSQA